MSRVPIIVTDHALARYHERITRRATREEIAAQVEAAIPCPRRLVKCIGDGTDAVSHSVHGGERVILLHEAMGAIFVCSQHADRLVVVTTIARGQAEWTYSRHGKKWHKHRGSPGGARKG